MKKMKKIILSAGVFLAAAALAGAQNMYDGILFSQNNYYGTARSMALGNAMTALGGDLGSVGINPAGSAVAPYGQFVITPGLTVSNVLSYYSREGESSIQSTNEMNTRRLNLPNIGLSFNFDTGRRYGVKSVSFGFLSNQTNNFNFDARGNGINGRTSKFAEFAVASCPNPEIDFAGYPVDLLEAHGSFNNTDIPWDILTAYQGGMFGSYGSDGNYVGVTELIGPDGVYCYVPGDLSQSAFVTKRGSKNDLVLNMAVNISDRLYVGFNLGLPTARYHYSETFYESAVNPDLFPIEYADGSTYFNRGVYNYRYLADVAGVYAKLGVIFRPVKGLRLGASFQTPTAYTVSESWRHSASTVFSDSRYNAEATSPEGEFSYNLRSPYIASFGAAITFGKVGFISADYEIADYSVMRFRHVHERYMREDAFTVENLTNKYFAGVSCSFRVGAELRVTPEWSLRAGYSVTTSPERWWTDTDGKAVTASDFASDSSNGYSRAATLMTPHYYDDRTSSLSAGFGYSSPGSFFLDAAVRYTTYPTTVYAPYFDYASSDRNGNIALVEAPRFRNAYDLLNVSLTLGWRF